MSIQPGSSARSLYAGLLEALTRVMGTAQGYLGTHGPRVGHLARQVAERMGMPRDEVGEILFAAVLADLGMVGLVEDAWENPVAVLTPEALARVRIHPVRSEALVQSIPHLEALAPLVRHHHEWWDGSGYPDRLRYEEIPEGARILRLADTVAALGEARPQRPALCGDAIRRVVVAGNGSEFAPEVADAYLSLLDEGEVTEFHGPGFHRAMMMAAERHLPPEVSPLSGEQLLDLLASIIDAKDPYTAGHSRRVAIMAVAVARQLALDEEMRDTVWAAGFLHDLGKLNVPLRVLAKEGPLDEDERIAVQLHTQVGAGILEDIPSLRHLTTGCRYHHERWDGGGYPEGLAGDRIPLVARILAVCDSYDAMTSGRAYRASRSHEEAMEEVARSTGRQFGPEVAASFLSLPDSIFQAVRRTRFQAYHERAGDRPSEPAGVGATPPSA